MALVPGTAAAGASKDALIRGGVLRGTISNYAGKVITLGTWFFLTPFILHHLGATDYALWVLAGSVVAYGSLLDFGIAGALTKYVAEYRATGKTADAQRLIATSLWLYSALGLLAFAGAVVLAMVFPLLFKVAPEQQTTARIVVLVMGVLLALQLPCATATATLQGLHRFDLVNLVGVAGTLGTAVTAMIVLSLGGGLLGLVVVSAPVTLIAQVTGVWLVHRSAPELRFSWRGADRRLVRPILGFSASVFALLVSNQLSTQSDEVVIGAVRQLSLVTPYALARKLSELPNALTRQFVKVLLPVASELHAEQDRGRLRAVYIAGTRITLAAYIAIGSTLAVFSGPALQVWVGQEYRAYAHLVVILVLASMIDTSLWPASAVLQGMARHRFLAITGVCAGVANVLLSIALIRPFGVTGVALATLIVNAIECLGFVLPYALRATGTSPALALRQILVPAAAPAVPALLLMVALRHTLPIESYLTLTLAGSAGIAVYGIAYFSLSAGEVEREALRDMVASAMRASRLRLRRA